MRCAYLRAARNVGAMFEIGDKIKWRNQGGKVIEVSGDRVAVLTEDDIIRITTVDALARMQPQPVSILR